MALVNWPPATGPSWPPPGYTNLEAGSLTDAQDLIQQVGATTANPTNTERNTYFRDARCEDGHTVTGIMVVWPNGTRYPFARCTDATHRQALVLWDPYTAYY